jgi:O-succinylbenzoic acid--CoA ligase
MSGGQRDKPEDTYPFSGFWINGRRVSFQNVLEEKESVRSSFEQTTFTFIREWLSGNERFEMTTSGSTGNPKGISLTRGQMEHSARQTARKIGLQRFSKSLVCIDTKYIAGKMMLVRSFACGLGIVAVDPCANPLIKVPVDNCVEFTAFVPLQVTAILESKHPHLLNGFDKILIGGAPLGLKEVKQLERYQCACYETYGMTETVSHVALRLVNTKSKQLYFETLPGIEITTDGRGCLVISADYLLKPVITNDLVQIHEGRKFEWLGRWDTVINTGGVKVVPEKLEKELERIFHETHFPNRFFIAASPDERLGYKVVLIIEGVQFSSETLRQSMDTLKSSVSPFEFPKEVYYIETFVLTPNQKIDRKESLSEATLLSSLK